jgi:hypothetical protein
MKKSCFKVSCGSYSLKIELGYPKNHSTKKLVKEIVKLIAIIKLITRV